MKDFSPAQIANLKIKAERKFRAIAEGSTEGTPFRYMTNQEQRDAIRKINPRIINQILAKSDAEKAAVPLKAESSKLAQAISKVHLKTQQHDKA